MKLLACLIHKSGIENCSETLVYSLIIAQPQRKELGYIYTVNKYYTERPQCFEDNNSIDV